MHANAPVVEWGPVLVPVLLRPSMPAVLKQRFMDAITTLVADKTVVVDATEYPKAYRGENYWGRFARMRQGIIDRYLHDERFVLWIDADIAFEPDLFQRLVATSPHAVVSPLVLIEGTQVHYDTAGTRPSFEERSSVRRPRPAIYGAFSVGCVVLVPAEVHHQVRFEAQADDDPTANTEWTSLCVGAAAQGRQVLWNTNIVTHHANLPAYGENFH
jgi:hypothetical protein